MKIYNCRCPWQVAALAAATLICTLTSFAEENPINSTVATQPAQSAQLCPACKAQDLTKEVCPSCSGKDPSKKPCSTCGGKPTSGKKCDWCRGKGTYDRKQCFVCNGTGRERPCWVCEGTGKMPPCGLCKGTGRRPPCSFCSGTGKVEGVAFTSHRDWGEDTPADIMARSAGSTSRLYMSGGSVPVFGSELAYRDYRKALELRDKHGMEQSFAAGGFMVPSGSRILVLDVGVVDPTIRKVRLLDGSKAGWAGWVPSLLIKALQ